MTSPASQLSALRRKETKTCPGCGEDFSALSVQKYCSNRCRQRVYKAKNRKVEGL